MIYMNCVVDRELLIIKSGQTLQDSQIRHRFNSDQNSSGVFEGVYL